MASRGRGALTARGTRRKYVHVGSVAASMPPHGPAIGEDTAPESWSVAFLKACWCSACVGKLTEFTIIRTTCIVHCLHMHTDHLHWSLPAHRRGTLRGMDAA
ncbi:hypothetical protein E1J24_15780 [Xanthomonas hortorum pv. pelargonii]|uniref:Uncharacterized protein n=1 Tax=Xanthomonas hortorum pv. pelargonii TaxID=453602 RepID=A0AAW9ZUD0_9XANT|nr:hypothetical protein [Xanthomonas hortorum pv. pelargonii]